MTPHRMKIWLDHGDKVGPADDYRAVMAAVPSLSLWQARRLITDVRKRGRPSDASVPPTAETGPGPAERGTVVEATADGLEARHTDTEINARIMNIDDLVAVAGIDLTRWEIASHKVNTWSTVTKGDDGDPTVTRLWQVSASLRPRMVPLIAPEWSPPPVFVAAPSASSAIRRAMILPDMQIGFRWRGLDTGTPWLEPYHDRRAIDLAIQTVARVRPDEVVLLGDNLDFQELSTRWAFGDDARQTTAIAIREYAWLLWRIRSVAPSARITYLLGNHEARLVKYLDERAGALANLRHHDGRPALCLRALLGLDALQIDSYAYPKPYWLWDRIEIEHGRVVRGGGGATAAAIAAKREHSVVYGHVHRRELAHRTVEGPGEAREVFVASPGCLCRTDGVVPGSDRPDWQQGVGLITSIDGSDAIDLIRIDRGRAVFGGEVLVGRDYAPELVEATGATAFLEPASRAA